MFRNYRMLAIVLMAVALALLAGCSVKDASDVPSATEQATVQSAAQDLVIPMKDLTGDAHFYPIVVDGTELEVIAVTAPDGSVRTAFNTCQICYDSGNGYYKQAGDMLVCQNCGNRFTMDMVGVTAGGCNPWPITETDRTIENESITIPYAFLQESVALFANWKAQY